MYNTLVETMEVNDLKQIFSEIIDAKFETINTKLDGINDHLKRLNGKVVEHERIINERTSCAYKVKELSTLPDKIRKLEDEQLSQKSVKRYLVGAIVLTGVITGIIFEVLKYING